MLKLTELFGEINKSCSNKWDARNIVQYWIRYIRYVMETRMIRMFRTICIAPCMVCMSSNANFRSEMLFDSLNKTQFRFRMFEGSCKRLQLPLEWKKWDFVTLRMFWLSFVLEILMSLLLCSQIVYLHAPIRLSRSFWIVLTQIPEQSHKQIHEQKQERTSKNGIRFLPINRFVFLNFIWLNWTKPVIV